MSEKFDPQIGKQPEKPEISREDFSALQENRAFLGFVEEFKSLQQGAEKKGIDISQAINYLEKGEGNPDLVRDVLLRLAQEDIEESKDVAERSGRPLSDRERAGIEAQTKHGKVLQEFNFFMKLPSLKKKIEADNAGASQQTSVEKGVLEKILRAGKEYSEEWIKKILPARKEFQKSMWDELRKYADLLQDGAERTPEVQEKIDYYIDLLTEKAAELAAQHGIARDEIFKVQDPAERYIDEEYIRGDDLRLPDF